jgi:hypothetical protein
MRRLTLLLVVIFLILLIGCQQKNTPPFAPSTPVGESLGFTNTNYNYTSSASDLDGDRVAIRFAWGDGDTSSWGFFGAPDSGITKHHTWTEAGFYSIRAQAKDEHDDVSGWSNLHQIMISNFNK